jgi:hypothetical protein
MSKMGQQTAHVYLENIMQFSFSSKWGEYTYFGCFVHIGRVREGREGRRRKELRECRDSRRGKEVRGRERKEVRKGGKGGKGKS